MLSLRIKDGVTILAITGEPEEFYDALSSYWWASPDVSGYSINGYCHSGNVETVFGFFYPLREPFEIECGSNADILRQLKLAWGIPVDLRTVISYGEYPDYERARGTTVSPPHRTG